MIEKLPWWKRLALKFIRAKVLYDEGDGLGDYTVKTTFKRMGGVVYIMAQERVILPPQHFNCRCAPVIIGEDDEIEFREEEHEKNDREEET